jgi:hypothetical protein
MHRAIAAMPAFPGIARTSVTRGDRAIEATSACSRAPAPTTRTRIETERSLTGIVGR